MEIGFRQNEGCEEAYDRRVQTVLWRLTLWRLLIGIRKAGAMFGSGSGSESQ